MNNVLEKIYTFARDAIKQLLDENPPLIVIINYGKVGYFTYTNNTIVFFFCHITDPRLSNPSASTFLDRTFLVISADGLLLGLKDHDI